MAVQSDQILTVTSNLSGIDCGNDCTASFLQGQTITLMASAGSKSVFAYWSGACTSALSTCSLIMSSDLTVTANFLSHSPKQQYRLLVTRLGNGTITSDDDKIACPADCNEKYDEGTTIGCSGDTCTVTMNRAKTVMAVFARDNKR